MQTDPNTQFLIIRTNCITSTLPPQVVRAGRWLADGLLLDPRINRLEADRWRPDAPLYRVMLRWCHLNHNKTVHLCVREEKVLLIFSFKKTGTFITILSQKNTNVFLFKLEFLLLWFLQMNLCNKNVMFNFCCISSKFDLQKLFFCSCLSSSWMMIGSKDTPK